MKTDEKIIEILKSIYVQNLELLKSQEIFLNDTDFLEFYKAYWINNSRLKNMIDILELEFKRTKK
ncbi:hypothetical protein [Lysinibacillus sp. C5.1]|uniref:hypothetical protein n=1 Tax=Lysinibacillus sp. C5.1 TaxID=2796169 RepID=UPI003081328B